MLLCLRVAAVIALMIRQFRKIKADSGKTPDHIVDAYDDHDYFVTMLIMIIMIISDFKPNFSLRERKPFSFYCVERQ